MKRFLCGVSSLTCGHCLTNGADASWRRAKLSPWGTEVFRGFDEPVDFHGKPLPWEYARSLREAQYRGVFVGRARAGKASLSAIPGYWSRWIVSLNRKRGAIPKIPCAGSAKAPGIWLLS